MCLHKGWVSTGVRPASPHASNHGGRLLPRRFALVRHVDYTGISGVGVVAYGVVFADGHVALRWSSDYPATSLWNSIDDLLAVHGHGEGTSIEWLDPAAEVFDRRSAARRGRRARRHRPDMPTGAAVEAPTTPVSGPDAGSPAPDAASPAPDPVSPGRNGTKPARDHTDTTPVNTGGTVEPDGDHPQPGASDGRGDEPPGMTGPPAAPDAPDTPNASAPSDADPAEGDSAVTVPAVESSTQGNARGNARGNVLGNARGNARGNTLGNAQETTQGNAPATPPPPPPGEYGPRVPPQRRPGRHRRPAPEQESRSTAPIESDWT